MPRVVPSGPVPRAVKSPALVIAKAKANVRVPPLKLKKEEEVDDDEYWEAALTDPYGAAATDPYDASWDAESSSGHPPGGMIDLI